MLSPAFGGHGWSSGFWVGVDWVLAWCVPVRRGVGDILTELACLVPAWRAVAMSLEW